MKLTRPSLCLFSLITLQLIVAPAGGRAFAQGHHLANPPWEKLSPAEQRERLVKRFKPARELLERKKVPFDPEELLRPGWDKRLLPTFAAMPEMQVRRKLGARLKGVQLGDILYLPEKVELTGDLVILARQVVFEGRNPVIKGHHSYQAKVDDAKGRKVNRWAWDVFPVRPR